MAKPIEIGCPKCHAAPNVRCLEPVKDGSKFVDYIHSERIERAALPAALLRSYE